MKRELMPQWLLEGAAAAYESSGDGKRALRGFVIVSLSLLLVAVGAPVAVLLSCGGIAGAAELWTAIALGAGWCFLCFGIWTAALHRHFKRAEREPFSLRWLRPVLQERIRTKKERAAAIARIIRLPGVDERDFEQELRAVEAERAEAETLLQSLS